MRWVLGWVLVGLAALVVTGNVFGMARASRTGRSFSALPFAGAILGLLAIAALPIDHKLRLLPLVLLDFTVPLALGVLVWLAFHRGSGPGK